MANKFIQDLESAAAEASKVETLKEENTKLEAQGASYKTVLAETENILNTLQASVEASESECAEIKSKVSQLQSSNQHLTQQIKDQESMSIFGLTAGIMTYVAFAQLLPLARKNDPDDQVVTICIFLGMFVIDLSMWIEK